MQLIIIMIMSNLTSKKIYSFIFILNKFYYEFKIFINIGTYNSEASLILFIKGL